MTDAREIGEERLGEIRSILSPDYPYQSIYDADYKAVLHEAGCDLLAALEAATARAEEAERTLADCREDMAKDRRALDVCQRDLKAKAIGFNWWKEKATAAEAERDAYRERADKVCEQMVNLLNNLNKGMEAPTGSQLEAFLDEWTELLEGQSPSPAIAPPPAPAPEPSEAMVSVPMPDRCTWEPGRVTLYYAANPEDAGRAHEAMLKKAIPPVSHPKEEALAEAKAILRLIAHFIHTPSDVTFEGLAVRLLKLIDARALDAHRDGGGR